MTNEELGAALQLAADVLREVEWEGATWDGGYAACPSCEGVRPEDWDLFPESERQRYATEGRGHKADCRLADALRKAGAR